MKLREHYPNASDLTAVESQSLILLLGSLHVYKQLRQTDLKFNRLQQPYFKAITINLSPLLYLNEFVSLKELFKIFTPFKMSKSNF